MVGLVAVDYEVSSRKQRTGAVHGVVEGIEHPDREVVVAAWLAMIVHLHEKGVAANAVHSTRAAKRAVDLVGV